MGSEMCIRDRRYAETLPQIDLALADLEAKVAGHLKQMGFAAVRTDL